MQKQLIFPPKNTTRINHMSTIQHLPGRRGDILHLKWREMRINLAIRGALLVGGETVSVTFRLSPLLLPLMLTVLS